MDDLISREAAAYIVDFECGEWRGLAKTIIDEFDALPSAQPQHKSAYLIAPHPYGRCSNCGQLIDIRDKYNYCPMCGRRLNHG